MNPRGYFLGSTQIREVLSADRQPRLHAVRAPDMASRACLITTYGDGTSPTSVLWFILPVVSEQRLVCVEPFLIGLRSFLYYNRGWL